MSQDPDQAQIEESLELLGQVTRQLMMAIMDLASQTGQSLPQVKTMLHLRKHGPCPVNVVARNLGVSPPTVSEHIDRLVEAGLVERQTNPLDRRQVLVRLSPDAWEMASTWYEFRCAQIQVVLTELDPEERRAFLRALKSLASVLARDPEEILALASTD